jgi:cytochrome b pre-mRNA-processing protein 3
MLETLPKSPSRRRGRAPALPAGIAATIIRGKLNRASTPSGVIDLSFLKRLFGDGRERAALLPLYRALVAAARDPGWYRQGGVPDTLDGRFDMVAALLALVLLRLEQSGARRESALLTEVFVDDMDSTLRQIGIGDFVVGKHVGGMMGALGGRLGAFREALAGRGDLDEAVRRNIFREAPPDEAKVAIVAHRLRGFNARLGRVGLESLLAAELPAP